MEIKEFVEATAKLETYYEKEYESNRRKIMYEELKDISIDRYKIIISKCIRSCKFLPKVADILEIDSQIPRQSLKTETVECKHCNGTGLIIYKKRNSDTCTEYNYACRCNCQNGDNISKRVPTIEMVNLYEERI